MLMNLANKNIVVAVEEDMSAHNVDADTVVLMKFSLCNRNRPATLYLSELCHIIFFVVKTGVCPPHISIRDSTEICTL